MWPTPAVRLRSEGTLRNLYNCFSPNWKIFFLFSAKTRQDKAAQGQRKTDYKRFPFVLVLVLGFGLGFGLSVCPGFWIWFWVVGAPVRSGHGSVLICEYNWPISRFVVSPLSSFAHTISILLVLLPLPPAPSLHCVHLWHGRPSLCVCLFCLPFFYPFSELSESLCLSIIPSSSSIHLVSVYFLCVCLLSTSLSVEDGTIDRHRERTWKAFSGWAGKVLHTVKTAKTATQ